MMINRQALVVVLASAATVQHVRAFAPSSLPLSSVGRWQPRSKSEPLRSSTVGPLEAKSREEDVELTRQVIMNHAALLEEEDATTIMEEENATPIVDVPPFPSVVEPADMAAPTPAATKAPKKKAPKKKGNPHKAGVFSPIVVAGKAVLGQDRLIKVRAKIIGIHSDLIKSFVGTSDSEFGQNVLRQLFNLVDTDNSGYLDKSEITVALNMLGFKWLGEKEVNKIFERADVNGDSEISLEEFMQETPKTLKVNLIKLAKQNGGEMGLLV